MDSLDERGSCSVVKHQESRDKRELTICFQSDKGTRIVQSPFLYFVKNDRFALTSWLGGAGEEYGKK